MLERGINFPRELFHVRQERSTATPTRKTTPNPQVLFPSPKRIVNPEEPIYYVVDNHEDSSPVDENAASGLNEIAEITLDRTGNFISLNNQREIENSLDKIVVTSASNPSSENTPVIYGFDLESVLLGCEESRKVIEEKLPNGNLIVRSHRQAISAALIEAVLLKLGSSPSKEALEQLARHLVNKYPRLGDPRRPGNGWQMWFQHKVKGLGASGFLEDRLRNQRKNLPKTKQTSVVNDELAHIDDIDWDSENDDDVEPDEGVLEYLRQNMRNESDVTSKMKSSVFMRRTIIRRICLQNPGSLSQIMQIMPRLFDVVGMIPQDFNIRHPPAALVLYQRWPQVAKVLLRYAEECGVDFQKKLDVRKSKYDLTDGDISLLAYSLLPHIMPSCARRIASVEEELDDMPVAKKPRTKKAMKENGAQNNKRKNKMSSVKATDEQCRMSLIQFRSRNTHVSDVLNSNNKMAPFILALGSTYNLDFSNFFVILNKVAVPCGDSFLVALDTCMKSFTVLEIPFPVESFDHWQFIVNCVGGKPCDRNMLPPVVQALAGQVMYKG